MRSRSVPLVPWFLPCVLLAITACDSGGPTDAGAPDGGSFDAGPMDAGAMDADTDSGVVDSGVVDSGAVDSGARDSSVDGGPEDASDGSAPSLLDRALEAFADPAADAALLDGWIRDVAWDGGWPLSDGDRWLFATRWDDAPSAVAMVGDVNGWSPSRAPATRAATSVHYFVVVSAADFDVAPAGAKYKWHGTPDVFRAPPEATAYGYDDFGEHGYVAPPTDLAWRERFPALASAHLSARRGLRAYLPAGFEPGSTAAASARALLLHDGQNVFDPDAPFGGWRVHEAVGAAGYEDVVVLAIDNAPDRFSAYTHVPDDIGTGGPVGGEASAYARLVIDEALPFFRARYGLPARGDSLAVGGSSLGGLVTLYLALTEPDLMGCVIAMSSTLGWGAFDASLSGADALVSRWSARGPVAVYLDSGGSGVCSDADEDGVDEDSDDSDNYCTTLQMRDRLAALGYTFDEDLFHWHEPGAGHNEAAWAARMPRALDACASAGWVGE